MKIEVSHVANGWPAALALVRAGFGVTVGPACLRQLAFEGISFHELPVKADVSTLWLLSRTTATNSAAKMFTKLLRSRAALAPPSSGA